MARDKLITIRIEGEKREAFNNLAKSQNTDTASLLYDFINQCLSGRIDISLVTGKKQWIDNQLDTNRLDKLETATQKIDERVGIIAKKLDDWIEAFGDRLTDCDRELSEKTISLEHRLNALAIQLDSQQIDSMDSKLNESIARLGSCFSQRLLGLEKRSDEMELLLRMQREASIATSPIVEPTGEPSPLPPSPPDRPAISEPDQPAIETVTREVSPSPPGAIASIDGTVETVEPNSSIETVASAIETVRSETDSSIDTGTGEAVTIGDKPWYTIDELLDCHYPGWPETKEGLRKKAKREHWPKRTRRGSKGNPYEYQAVLPE